MIKVIARGRGAASVLRANGQPLLPPVPSPLSPASLPCVRDGTQSLVHTEQALCHRANPCWSHLFQVTLHTGLEVPTNLGRPKLSGN